MKLILVFLLLFFFLFGCSPSVPTEPPTKQNPEPPTERSPELPTEQSPEKSEELPVDSQKKQVQAPVWLISSSLSYGTAFAIDSNLFVTNFHVLYPMLKNSDSIKKIILQQESNSSILRVNRLVRVSALYDLAIFETKEKVTNYLSIKEDLPNPLEKLFVWGYPGREFKKIKKTGDFAVDNFQYTFPVNYFKINGASGSPVLNKHEQVVAIIISAVGNLLSAVKAHYLKKLFVGDIGLDCSVSSSLTICMDKEMESFREIAKQGLPAIQYNLAIVYSRMKNMDFELSFHLFQKSSDQGYAPAQYMLAMMHYKGETVKQDLSLAFHLFQKSSDQGYAPAQYMLAMMHYKGETVKQDLSLAFHLFQKSSDQGYAPAQYMLAMMHYKGEAVKQDLSLAFHLFQESSDQGYAPAQYMLAMMHYGGQGTEGGSPDFIQALYWYKQAAVQGYYMGQYKAAMMYEMGEGTKGGQPDFVQALYWYKQAANQNHAPSQFNLAIMYYKGKGIEKRNKEEAIRWVKKAAALGHTLAKNFLKDYNEKDF